MELEILGAHNCESRTSKLTSLLIDKKIAIDAGGLTSSLSFEEQRRIKAILITHHHFDHIRDLATFGMNNFTVGPTNVYATQSVLDVISSYLFDGVLYLDFRRRPTPEQPALKLCPVEPYKEVSIEGYAVLPVPVNHVLPTTGYQVTSPDGKTLFYTGDTSRNPASLWEAISPDLMVIEATMPNKYAKAARESGHLTPQLLKEELVEFNRVKGYMPNIVAVHMIPNLESEIGKELAKVAQETGAQITLGYEGMKVVL
jgi:ribonuclease BN (tRNA processing enzyme)